MKNHTIVAMIAFLGISIFNSTAEYAASEREKCPLEEKGLRANQLAQEMSRAVYKYTHPQPSLSNFFGLKGQSKGKVVKALANLQEAIDTYDKAKKECE